MLNSSLPLLAGVLAGFLSGQDYPEHTQLNDKLASVLREEALTGMAWMTVGEAGHTVTGAVGLRDAERRLPFTTETRFHVGSLTKSLLATGVLRMATRGMLDLDEPASNYLPGLDFSNPWSDSAKVTIRHLLDHTSGLNDAHLWQMFSERPGPDTPLLAAFPDPETQLRIRSRPGDRFSYSNMGYALLGIIIETITGERYESWLDRHLLKPLGMRNSTFNYTSQTGQWEDPDLAWGHVDDGSRVAASPLFLRPAGQFTSTAQDLAVFARFLLSEGWVDGEPFVSKELMHARGRPVTTQAARKGLVAGYALGLGRRDRHGVIGLCHSGNIVGFMAMLCVFPDDNQAFAYSVNTDSESANYGRIEEAMGAALRLTPAASPDTREPAGDVLDWLGRYILSPNRFQTFRYLDTVFGATRVSASALGLDITSLQRDPHSLRPLGSYIYSAEDRRTASHVFLRDEGGEFLYSDGFQTYEMVPPAYLFAHWTSVFLGLLGLGWLWAAGVVSLVRERSKALRRPEVPAFFAILALAVPVPFFMSQSFMALGDFTVASALLALVTLLLPIGMLVTVLKAGKDWRQGVINRIHGVAALLVLQWCAVLVTAGMLPLRLWA